MRPTSSILRAVFYVAVIACATPVWAGANTDDVATGAYVGCMSDPDGAKINPAIKYNLCSCVYNYIKTNHISSVEAAKAAQDKMVHVCLQQLVGQPAN